MRSSHALLIAVAVTASAAAFGATGQPRVAPAATPSTAAPIAVSVSAPPDISPNAPTATLGQAAAFAWDEFFALNWTAKTKDNNGNSLRDTADPSCPFGKPSCSQNSPLVWQTYRGKVEIFPGTGTAPASYSSAPPSYGYDGGPSYIYSTTPPTGTPPPIPACTNQPAAAAPWVNLDETDQIALDSMYAGVGPTPVPNASPGATNSQPQLIRFVAKANRALYSYIAGYQFWTGTPGGTPVPGSPDPTPAVPPYGSPAPTLVSLPNGTIETKSGWRPLTSAEANAKPARFVTATVRYYENATGQTGGPPCWRQGTFGLVALHIIQKTPTAPYFVYATFEQADNILTASGARVEDDNGRTSPSQLVVPPTTPQTQLQDVTKKVPPRPQIPPRIVANGPPCPAHGARLYYRNAANRKAAPQGVTCVNRRQNPIPQEIISANVAAHTVLANYEAANGGYHSPFEHYKLINVQYVPIDKDSYGPYTGPAPATFSQANIVVETNHTLQLFTGGLVGGFNPTGSNSENPYIFNQSLGKTTFKNTLYNSKAYNMGGCMGCHGAAGQRNGGDFSVITAVGTVSVAEYPAPVTSAGDAAVVPRNRYPVRPISAHYRY